MEKRNKIIQIYAVVICVVAVITFIISVSSIVSATIDRNDPIYAGRFEQKLSSFENFKMDVLKSTQKDQAFIPNDEIINGMYDAAKENKIKTVLHQTYRTIVVSSLVIIICIILFGSHWWLMRKMGK